MRALKLGRRYRINQQGHKADGRVGVLESVINGEAWLMIAGRLVKAPTQNLTDRNVVQEDLTPLRIRPEPQLLWGENEVFA